MAEKRRGGLGEWGLSKSRDALGRRTVAGHTLTAAQEQRADNPDTDVRDLPTTPWEFPESSRVKAYQYDYKTGQLRVKFIKYGTPWVYDNVPTTVFQAFDAAPSKGKYINSTLNYMEYRRANPQEEAQFFGNV